MLELEGDGVFFFSMYILILDFMREKSIFFSWFSEYIRIFVFQF